MKKTFCNKAVSKEELKTFQYSESASEGYAVCHDTLLLFTTRYRSWKEEIESETTKEKRLDGIRDNLKTLKELRRIVLDFGPIHRKNLTKQVSELLNDESLIHVRPGYSANRYMSSALKIWDPLIIEKLLKNEFINKRLIETYFKLILPDIIINGTILRDTLLRQKPHSYTPIKLPLLDLPKAEFSLLKHAAKTKVAISLPQINLSSCDVSVSSDFLEKGVLSTAVTGKEDLMSVDLITTDDEEVEIQHQSNITGSQVGNNTVTKSAPLNSSYSSIGSSKNVDLLMYKVISPKSSNVFHRERNEMFDKSSTSHHTNVLQFKGKPDHHNSMHTTKVTTIDSRCEYGSRYNDQDKCNKENKLFITSEKSSHMNGKNMALRLSETVTPKFIYKPSQLISYSDNLIKDDPLPALITRDKTICRKRNIKVEGRALSSGKTSEHSSSNTEVLNLPALFSPPLSPNSNYGSSLYEEHSYLADSCSTASGRNSISMKMVPRLRREFELESVFSNEHNDFVNENNMSVSQEMLDTDYESGMLKYDGFQMLPFDEENAHANLRKHSHLENYYFHTESLRESEQNGLIVPSLDEFYASSDIEDDLRKKVKNSENDEVEEKKEEKVISSRLSFDKIVSHNILNITINETLTRPESELHNDGACNSHDVNNNNNSNSDGDILPFSSVLHNVQTIDQQLPLIDDSSILVADDIKTGEKQDTSSVVQTLINNNTLFTHLKMKSPGDTPQSEQNSPEMKIPDVVRPSEMNVPDMVCPSEMNVPDAVRPSESNVPDVVRSSEKTKESAETSRPLEDHETVRGDSGIRNHTSKESGGGKTEKIVLVEDGIVGAIPKAPDGDGVEKVKGEAVCEKPTKVKKKLAPFHAGVVKETQSLVVPAEVKQFRKNKNSVLGKTTKKKARGKTKQKKTAVESTENKLESENISQTTTSQTGTTQSMIHSPICATEEIISVYKAENVTTSSSPDSDSIDSYVVRRSPDILIEESEVTSTHKLDKFEPYLSRVFRTKSSAKIHADDQREDRRRKAEARREKVERKRKESEFRLVQAIEKRKREEKLRQDFEAEERRIVDEKLATARFEKERQRAAVLQKIEAKDEAEKQKLKQLAEQEFAKHKLNLLFAERRAKLDFKKAQERLAAEIEADLLSKEQEFMESLDSESRAIYMREKEREEEERRVQEEERKKIRIRKQQEEERDRSRQMKELEMLHTEMLRKRFYVDDLKKADNLLAMNHSFNRAFTSSYHELLPYILYRSNIPVGNNSNQSFLPDLSDILETVENEEGDTIVRAHFQS